MYHGRPGDEVYERERGDRVPGMSKNGVEYGAETGFVCRAVMLDAVASLKSQGKRLAAEDKRPIPKKCCARIENRCGLFNNRRRTGWLRQ